MCKFIFELLLIKKNVHPLKKHIRLDKEHLKGELNSLMKTQQMLEQNVLTSKCSYDELTAKDQSLDKQFRTLFLEIVSSAIIDQAYRIFK